MKRRQVLTATAVATAATLGTAATASAAPGHGEHTPPGLAKKDTLAWAAGGVIEIGSAVAGGGHHTERSEEHTSELQSRFDLVCRLLLEKKKDIKYAPRNQMVQNT